MIIQQTKRQKCEECNRQAYIRVKIKGHMPMWLCSEHAFEIQNKVMNVFIKNG